MGFFGIDNEKRKEEQKRAGGVKTVPVALLRRQECEACTLRDNPFKAKNPRMPPSGNKRPRIYVVTDAPSDLGDRNDNPLHGLELDVIQPAFPRVVWRDLRFGNLIRCWPGQGPDEKLKFNDGEMSIETTNIPTPHQIECCRPKLIRDIEATRPDAIFGFGGSSLRWVTGEGNAHKWSGRRIPVRVGNHLTWFYAFDLPIDVVKGRRWEEHVTEWETTLQMHVAKAVEEVYGAPDRYGEPTQPLLPRPVIDSEEFIKKNCFVYDGAEGMGDVRAIEKFFDRAVQDRINGIDLETNALRPYNKRSKILTASVSRKGEAIAWALRHKGSKFTTRELDFVEDAFVDYLKHQGPRKIAHQLPFEMEWLGYTYGEQLLRGSKWGDSLSQAFVLNTTQGLLSLESRTIELFGFNLKEMSAVDRAALDEYPVNTVLKYNCYDSKYHREVYLEQEPKIWHERLEEVYEHQLSRIPTLVLTSLQGVPVDQKVVASFRDDYESRLKLVEDQIRDEPYFTKFLRKYREEFNEASTHHIKKFLVDILGEDKARKLDSTKEAVLAEIDHPLIPLILKRRKLNKVLATYVQAVCEEYVDRNGETVPRSPNLFDDDELHPIIATTKVTTSRTSSEAPNVQNWPKRSENVVVRKQIPARPGHKLVSLDFGGIQARNVAMESRDERLVKAFWDRYDIHTDFMKKIIDIYPKWLKKGESIDDPKVRKEKRHLAKNKFVFPTFFGAKGKRVAADCGLPLELGKELQEEFFKDFPRIDEWQKQTQRDYKEKGYVTGLSGYRRHAPISWNELINSPIQADETRIVMSAMTALSELGYQAMFEIHDDLTFQIPKATFDRDVDIIIREMLVLRYDWINVPMVVEMAVGDNWADMKDVAKFENVGRDGRYVEFHE